MLGSTWNQQWSSRQEFPVHSGCSHSEISTSSNLYGVCRIAISMRRGVGNIAEEKVKQTRQQIPTEGSWLCCRRDVWGQRQAQMPRCEMPFDFAHGDSFVESTPVCFSVPPLSENEQERFRPLSTMSISRSHQGTKRCANCHQTLKSGYKSKINLRAPWGQVSKKSTTPIYKIMDISRHLWRFAVLKQPINYSVVGGIASSFPCFSFLLTGHLVAIQMKRSQLAESSKLLGDGSCTKISELTRSQAQYIAQEIERADDALQLRHAACQTADQHRLVVDTFS